MNFRELFITALMALRGNLLRTLLTMLGIVIGIASVILIISLVDGATKVITREIEGFGTNKVIIFPGSFQDGSYATIKTLTIDDAKALMAHASDYNITNLSPIVNYSGSISGNGETISTSVTGVAESYISMQNSELAEGEFLGEEDINGYARVAVVGPKVVSDLFGEDADVIGKSIKIDKRSFRIVGVTAPKESIDRPPPDQLVYVPYTTMMKMILGQFHLQGILIQVNNSDLVDDTINKISLFLRDRHNLEPSQKNDFSIQSSKDLLNTLGTVTGLLTGLLAGIAGISLLVGGIGIMNIMLVTVTERTKEIGLLKAIGARKRDILTQFLIESVVLTLVCGAIAMTMGILFSFLITSVAKIPFIISPVSLLLAVGVSSGVGIVFGIYPASRAAKLSPIDALRHD